MNYPLELLPNPNYKFIDCDLANYYLIRSTSTSNRDEIWDKETNTIKIEQIYYPSERVSDLSSSLLGVYNKLHIFLDFTSEGKSKYMHYCNPNELVEPPIYDTDFALSDNHHYWCIQILHLNNQKFDYSIGNDNFQATCLVMHTPMRWNFWHFSLRWKLDSGILEDMDDKQRKKIARKIGHVVRASIVHFATIEEPIHSFIPEACYHKN